MEEARFEGFISALEEERHAHEALSSLLDLERDALLRVDMEALAAVVDELRELRCRMRPMAARREKLTRAMAAALSIPEAEMSLRAMAQALPADQAARLDALRREFANALAAVNASGDLAGALLSARLTAIRRNIDFLSARQALGNNYGNAGMPAPDYERVSLMDTEI